jgi:hypothetical protein
MARRKGFTWYFGLSMLILGWPSIVLVLAVNFLPIERPLFRALRDSPASNIYSFTFFAVVISTLFWTVQMYLMRRRKR